MGRWGERRIGGTGHHGHRPPAGRRAVRPGDSAALRKVERRYGDGYMNAVLLDLLDESEMCKGGEIADVRKYVHANSPERSRSYGLCRELIANKIGGRAVELRDKLKYSPEEPRQ